MEKKLYSDDWYLEEIEKIKSLSTNISTINPKTVAKKIQGYLDLEFRSPIEIASNKFCDDVFSTIKNNSFSLIPAFNDFNENLHNEMSLENFLDILRNFDEYKKHLIFTYLYMHKDFFKKRSYDEYLNFIKCFKIAALLEIEHNDYRNFVEFLDDVENV